MLLYGTAEPAQATDPRHPYNSPSSSSGSAESLLGRATQRITSQKKTIKHDVLMMMIMCHQCVQAEQQKQRDSRDWQPDYAQEQHVPEIRVWHRYTLVVPCVITKHE
ncbi:unnamed protein product [Gongylonema pulchrum]|uniref:Uncharacterized protein n=1 Tax=Gongylonema pulchrum TaxID=637853 RepID=A0A3P6PMH9_9BILA|nr:unnamed protein product [Gongylonema pulchrum]